MLITPMDILHQFPIRKTKMQKQKFRAAVQSYAQSLGYTVNVEEGSMGCRNVVIGDPDKAQYLVTAHYDTCSRMMVPNILMPDNPLLYTLYQIGVNLLLLLLSGIVVFLCAFLSMLIYGACAAVPDGVEMGAVGISVFTIILVILFLVLQLSVYFGPANRSNANDNTSGVVTLLEILRTLPENQRHKVCFVLFDLNEAGLIGSKAYRKAHKAAIQNQIMLELSCVGDGDHMLMIPTKTLKNDVAKYKSLFRFCGYFGKKSLLVMDKGRSLVPSDHKNFPYGVCFMACQKGKTGHYISRIHTSKDTILEETNVNILRAAITSMICGTAAQ